MGEGKPGEPTGLKKNRLVKVQSKDRLKVTAAVCANCGFGEFKEWKPRYPKARCPMCGSDRKAKEDV